MEWAGPVFTWIALAVALLLSLRSGDHHARIAPRLIAAAVAFDVLLFLLVPAIITAWFSTGDLVKDYWRVADLKTDAVMVVDALLCGFFWTIAPRWRSWQGMVGLAFFAQELLHLDMMATRQSFTALRACETRCFIILLLQIALLFTFPLRTQLVGAVRELPRTLRSVRGWAHARNRYARRVRFLAKDASQ